jgi:hypothetical protein
MLYCGCQLAHVPQVSFWPGVVSRLLSYSGSNPVASTIFPELGISQTEPTIFL